jgi:hypothetical protein
MKSATAIVFLLSTAISCTFAQSKLVTIPFTAVERTSGIRASSSSSKKLGELVDVPLENIDLAYLIDIEVGKKMMLRSVLIVFDTD